MENAMQEPYRDSPASSRSSSPTLEGLPSTAKPLPSLPDEAPPYSDEPYHDEPTATEGEPSIASPTPQRIHAASNITHEQAPTYFPPYTDAIPEGDDDVPLAYLYSYPTEAPPSYHVAVRQSYRDTLIQHIPTNSGYGETDEEAGVERSQPDDVRFSVERIVAAIIVSTMLLLIAALLAWLALHTLVSSKIQW